MFECFQIVDRPSVLSINYINLTLHVSSYKVYKRLESERCTQHDFVAF